MKYRALIQVLIFALLISFIERRLCCLFPHAGIRLGPNHKLYTNYADDIKLICKSTTELGAIYK